MFKHDAGLIIKRAVAIPTQTPLKHAIAAVLNRRFATAAWAIDAVVLANLLQQVRGAMLRDERFDRKHRLLGDAAVSPFPTMISSYDFQLLLRPE